MIKLRNMKHEDALGVATVHVLGWKKAYEGILPQPYLDSLDIQKKALSWKNGMEVNADLVRIVATDQKEIVGFVCGLENRYPEIIPQVECELWAIYVHPQLLGQGVGTKLFEAFKKSMQKLKSRSMGVWVLDRNLKAHQFYQKMGGTLLPQDKSLELGEESFVEAAYLFELD